MKGLLEWLGPSTLALRKLLLPGSTPVKFCTLGLTTPFGQKKKKPQTSEAGSTLYGGRRGAHGAHAQQGARRVRRSCSRHGLPAAAADPAVAPVWSVVRARSVCWPAPCPCVPQETSGRGWVPRLRRERDRGLSARFLEGFGAAGGTSQRRPT